MDKGGRDTFSLTELQRALHLAILEISMHLDPHLECAATIAGGDKYCIAVDMDDFYAGRDGEIKSLVDLDDEDRDAVIATYDRDAVCDALEQAREEIGWLENEGRRLEVHMEVADTMKRSRLRNRFVFRPLTRGWSVSCGSPDVDMLDGDSLVVEDGEVAGAKDETEEHRLKRESRKDSAQEEQEKTVRKERRELFKREADVGFGTATVEHNPEDGGEQEAGKTDSPLVGLAVRKGKS